MTRYDEIISAYKAAGSAYANANEYVSLLLRALHDGATNYLGIPKGKFRASNHIAESAREVLSKFDKPTDTFEGIVANDTGKFSAEVFIVVDEWEPLPEIESTGRNEVKYRLSLSVRPDEANVGVNEDEYFTINRQEELGPQLQPLLDYLADATVAYFQRHASLVGGPEA